jgi:integrase
MTHLPGFSYDSKRRRARLDIYVPGEKGRVRRRRTLEGVTRDVALAEWRKFRDTCMVLPPAGPVTLKQFTDSYYPLIAAALAPSTVATQRAIIRNHLIRYFGETELTSITSIRILDFKADLRNRAFAAATINDAVRVLKMLLRQAVERDVIAEYPVKKRIPNEPENPLRLELNSVERRAFFVAFDDESGFRAYVGSRRSLGPVRESLGFSAPRRFGGGLRGDSDAAHRYFLRFSELKDFFLVAVETGIRLKSDLRRLAWRDVDLEQGVIRIVMKKTHREALIPISATCREALGRRKAISAEGEYVFVDERRRLYSETRINRVFALAKSLAGIKRRFRPHDLRHTFACRLASAGVSLQIIAKSLGHTTTQMAERYARPSTEAMRMVCDALERDRI